MKTSLTNMGTLSLLLFFFFLSLPTLSHSLRCHPHDEKVLRQIMVALGRHYEEYEWEFCCTIPGIECNETTTRVTSLVFLRDPTISGHIPDIVGDLPYLETLCFFKLPNLTGGIPFALTRLTRLQTLVISWTNVSGPIPSFLGQIKTLARLTLSFNQLSGSIPPSLSSLPNLELLDLGRNRLTGVIPESFGYSPPSLQILHLSHNQLTGVPRSLGYKNFTVIDFSRNHLVGDVAFLFGKNKTYDFVDLSRNNLTFDGSKIKVNAGAGLGLYHLDVNHNRITGNLPASLKNSDVRFLNVSYNRMCGEIPKSKTLQNFDYSSYFHNRCLCGAPLPPCK